MTKKKLGLIINPIAGLGGRVGLKGSDGTAIQEQALALGAISRSTERAKEALTILLPIKDDLEIITYPACMGENLAKSLGFQTTIVGSIDPKHTEGADTRRAAQDLIALDTRLLLFAGGDGTARDIYDAIGLSALVLGIPAGVKIQSAVFATHPRTAGQLALQVLRDEKHDYFEAEVIDLNETTYRTGYIQTRLYGYLNIPAAKQLTQSTKSPSPMSERSAAHEVGHEIIRQMKKDRNYILGPGTTTKAITNLLGIEKTLLGVDVVRNKKLLLSDANEMQLLEILAKYPHQCNIIITPIGGQGYLFGRGNQQISPEVIKKVGFHNIQIISTMNKVLSLKGKPLIADTGDAFVDKSLQGYSFVITGNNQRMVYQIK